MEISEEMLEELAETTTHRRKWWAIRFETGWYGENIRPGEGIEGFTFSLYSSKEGAHEAARDFLEDEEIPYEVVEICWSEVG